MAALNTGQLLYLGKHLASIRSHVDFLGVFSADLIPLQVLRSRSRDTCFIVNTDHSSLPGTHWLAFYYHACTRKFDYFDSFGQPLSFYSQVCSTFRTYLNHVAAVNNSVMLQSLTSAACGYYCILFLHLAARLVSSAAATNVIARLANTSIRRDYAVIHKVHNLMHTFDCSNLSTKVNSNTTQQTCCSRMDF